MLSATASERNLRQGSGRALGEQREIASIGWAEIEALIGKEETAARRPW